MVHRREPKRLWVVVLGGIAIGFALAPLAEATSITTTKANVTTTTIILGSTATATWRGAACRGRQPLCVSRSIALSRRTTGTTARFPAGPKYILTANRRCMLSLPGTVPVAAPWNCAF
jgi:hypothetical protein